MHAFLGEGRCLSNTPVTICAVASGMNVLTAFGHNHKPRRAPAIRAPHFSQTLPLVLRLSDGMSLNVTTRLPSTVVYVDQVLWAWSWHPQIWATYCSIALATSSSLLASRTNPIAASKSEVILCWVSDHRNVEDNEIANELERLGGSSMDICEVDTLLNPPISYFLARHGQFGRNWTRLNLNLC